jgi:murein DD-endopeptidase MepM/ murein hydrolase activator NlpD
MTYPIPGVGISTAYGKRGQSWSCNENSSGGIHTGVDFACAKGTLIVAPIAGQIRHRNYGSAFGNHQFAISPDPGQPFGEGEVFFAHTTDRPADGAYVNIGDPLAHVGAEGNVTGPHLHFEFHPEAKGVWNCSVHANPQVVLDHGGSAPPTSGDGGYPTPTSKTVYLDKLKYGQEDSDSVWYLQDALNAHPLDGGETLPLSGNYLSETDEEVRLCQTQHGFGSDPVNGSYVGSKQAEHLFAGRGITIK